MMIPALGLAVLAAILNSAGDLAQRHSTRREPVERSGSVWLVLDLARRPVWIAGLLASLLGLASHVTALSLGELSAVQPLLTLELPLAVFGASRLFGVRPARRDWIAVAMLTCGLAAFVACLDPRGGDPDELSGPAWAAGLGTVTALVVVLVVVAVRTRGNPRAAALGAAAGAGYGTTAVLFSAAGSLAGQGPAAVLAAWQPWTAVAVGLVSFYLLQNALTSGLLVAVEPGLTLVNPIVAVTWGLLLFGEQARTGAWLIGTLTGAALLAAGTMLLARSPVLHAEQDTPSAPQPDRAGR